MGKLFYDRPTQVVFINLYNENERTGGIAYRDEIICGEYGAVINLEDLYDEAAELGIERPVIEREDWVSFSDLIMQRSSSKK